MLKWENDKKICKITHIHTKFLPLASCSVPHFNFFFFLNSLTVTLHRFEIWQCRKHSKIRNFIAQKMQKRKLRIWWHLPKKASIKSFIFLCNENHLAVSSFIQIPFWYCKTCKNFEIVKRWSAVVYFGEKNIHLSSTIKLKFTCYMKGL